MRVTDSATMDVVEMVLGGSVNKHSQPHQPQRWPGHWGYHRQRRQPDQRPQMEVTRYRPELKAPEIIDIGQVGEVRSDQPQGD